MATAVEPLLDKAAKLLGIDQVAIRHINAPTHESLYGADRSPITSAYLREALEQGAERFGWEERRARSGQRDGSKVRGVAVGQAFHSAGASGFDGLVRITPEGKLHVHSGVGNLGTYSYASTSRVAIEVLGYRWENSEIVRGDSSKGLPWTLGQFGSNTSFTMTRTNFAAATDAVRKLKEIAARRLGGSASDYDIGNETVFARGNPGRRLTYAQAAQAAIEIGGEYSGHEVPDDINDMTRRAVAGLAGTGMIGVARDNLEPDRDGSSARGRIHRDRARSRDRQHRDPRLPRRRRLRDGSSSAGAGDSDQGRGRAWGSAWPSPSVTSTTHTGVCRHRSAFIRRNRPPIWTCRP